MQGERAKDDEAQVIEHIQAAREIHLAYVAAVGNGEAEKIDAVETALEGIGLATFAVGFCIASADAWQQRGGDGEGGQRQNQQGHVPFAGRRKEGGHQDGDAHNHSGQQKG